MIRLTEAGVDIRANLDELRERFACEHVLRVPGLLSEGILDRVQSGVATGKWIEKVHPGIKSEIVLDDARTFHLLHFLMNNAGFLDAVRSIADRPEIENFRGRIYRMVPGLGHLDSWHNDVNPEENRLVGLSINIGPAPFEGGVFELRHPGAADVLEVVANVVPGDAFLFRVSPELQHRVTPVVGNAPKTAFAGWFKANGGRFLAAGDASGSSTGP